MQPLTFSLQWIYAHNAVFLPRTEQVLVGDPRRPNSPSIRHQVPHKTSTITVTTLSLTDACAMRVAQPDEE
eukprot:763878-Hanusia_phi.AAC.2